MCFSCLLMRVIFLFLAPTVFWYHFYELYENGMQMLLMGFRQCLSFAFNSIISHCPAIKSIFRSDHHLYIMVTQHHTKSIKNWLKKKLLHRSLAQRSDKEWAIVIYRTSVGNRQELGSQFYYFSIIFPSKGIAKLLLLQSIFVCLDKLPQNVFVEKKWDKKAHG